MLRKKKKTDELVRLKPKKKKKKPICRFLIKTGILVLVVASLNTWVIAPKRMSGNTMFPSFRDGDFGVFYQLDRKFVSNDIVLYERPDGKKAVGRIVAVGGQSVEFMKDGGYQVDRYVPVDEVPYPTYASEKTTIKNPLKLKEDEYFILNDFRSNTNDSREFGAVTKDAIVGKMLMQFRRRGF